MEEKKWIKKKKREIKYIQRKILIIFFFIWWMKIRFFVPKHNLQDLFDWQHFWLSWENSTRRIEESENKIPDCYSSCKKRLKSKVFFSTLLLFNNADNRKVLLRTELRKITTRKKKRRSFSIFIVLKKIKIQFYSSFSIFCLLSNTVSEWPTNRKLGMIRPNTHVIYFQYSTIFIHL